MIKKILLILFIGHSSISFAQQINTFGNYIIDPFSLNPAVAGLRSCASALVGYRAQWNGIEGAPTTTMLSYNMLINRSKRNSFVKHGIGLHFQNQEVGNFKNNYLKLGYAIHLRLWRKYKMSLGMFVGMQQVSISDVDLPSATIDPAFANRSAIVAPDIAPGIFIYTESFGFGASMMQTYTQVFGSLGKDAGLRQHLFMAAYKKFQYNDWELMPSTLVRLEPLLNPTADLNFTAEYNNLFAIGGGVKSIGSLQAIVNVKILDRLSVGYSFEYPFTPNKLAMGATNEIIIGYSNCFNKSNYSKFICPVFE